MLKKDNSGRNRPLKGGKHLRRRKQNAFLVIIPVLFLAIFFTIVTLFKYSHNLSKENQIPNNTQELQRQQSEQDTTAPEINLLPLQEKVLQNIEDFIEPGYTAIDNVDGDITDSVETSIKKVKPNYYRISYTVTDSNGNQSSKNRMVKVVKGQIALTFDDGPSLTITPQILNTLYFNDVKATFFVLAFDEQKAALIQREYKEGHTIGYHGYSHKYSEIYTSIDTLMENFYKIEHEVTELTGGTSSKIIRFPGGSSNTVSQNYCTGIMTEAVNRVTNEGYVYFDWNIDSDDAGSAKSVKEIYNNIISGICPDRLNVVLMHDSADKTLTMYALQDIIDYGVKNDYEFVTLTTESIQIKHNVSN